MANKAKLVFFSGIDVEYGRKYGIMPDYHFTQLLAKGVHPDVVSYLINTRMRLIWNRMKYEHDHAEEIQKQKEEAVKDFKNFQPLPENAYVPF